MAIWSYKRGDSILDIKVGYSCNNRCIHCVVDPVKAELSEHHRRMNLSNADVKHMIDGAVEAGLTGVVLTGGEVTIRKDFRDLVEYAANKGLQVIVQTNARQLSDLHLCNFLRDLPRIVFIVAVHAPSVDVHDGITKVKGSFQQTITAVANLLSVGQHVVAKTVISKRNYRLLGETAVFVRDIGAAKSCFAFPHAPGFLRSPFEDVVPTYASIRDEIEKIAQFSEASGFPVDFETIPFCTSMAPSFWKRSCDVLSKAAHADLCTCGRTHSAPFCDGTHAHQPSAATARSCSKQQRGDAAATIGASSMFDWEVLRPTMKHKPRTCRNCVFDLLCEGPWAEYIDHYGQDELVPVTGEAVSALFQTGATVASAPSPSGMSGQLNCRRTDEAALNDFKRKGGDSYAGAESSNSSSF